MEGDPLGNFPTLTGEVGFSSLIAWVRICYHTATGTGQTRAIYSLLGCIVRDGFLWT